MARQKGFTIIEIVISIFIITVAVVGIYSAFSLAVILSSDSANRLTAAYLVQEGQEKIRNIRDTNWLNDRDWLDNGLGICTGDGCEVDYTYEDVKTWAGKYLYKNENGFYIYSDVLEPEYKTKFKRRIIIEPLANYAVLVTVKVAWDEKANLLYAKQSADNCDTKYNCVEAETTLYNWYPEPTPVPEP